MLIIIHIDITSTAQVEDGRILQFDKFSCKLHSFKTLTTQSILELIQQLIFVAHNSQGFETRLIATIIKRKESDLAAERKEKLWLEEKCENLEQELKKVTNEKYKEIQVVQDKFGIKDYFKLLIIIDLNAAAVSKLLSMNKPHLSKGAATIQCISVSRISKQEWVGLV